MSTSGDPIFNESGEFVGYHGTGRDRTADVAAAEELHQAKEQAEAANRAKSEFFGEHESRITHTAPRDHWFRGTDA